MSLQGKSLVLTYPEDLDGEIRPFFAQFPPAGDSPAAASLQLRHAAAGTFELHRDNVPLWGGLVWPSALATVLEEIESTLCALLKDAPLRAGAVRHGDRAAMIVGPPGSHKTALTAWLVDRGCYYLADNLVGLDSDHAHVHGERNSIVTLALPLAAHLRAEADIRAFQSFSQSLALAADDRFCIRPERVAGNHDTPQPCGLVIVPKFLEGAAFSVEILKPEELRLVLGLAARPHGALTYGDRWRIDSFAKAVPAILVTYGSYGQLVGKLDALVRDILGSGLDMHGVWHYLADRDTAKRPSGAKTTDTPLSIPVTATAARYPKRLTIGMATHDDYDGVYFTLQSLRLYHPEVIEDIELIVADNNPDGICGTHLKDLEKSIPNYRYIPVRERYGTAIRDVIFEEASSDFVLCLDCHVMLAPGSVAKLMGYFEANPQTQDLLQGPMIHDDLARVATHMKPEWSGCFYGTWGTDERGTDPAAAPFEIDMHGLGLYACRRSAWPWYSTHFRGFGGEEGYIHEKFRQAGGRTLCLPFLRWVHRTPRPLGVPYKMAYHDRIRNYLIGFDEMGLSPDQAIKHFRWFIGEAIMPVIAEIQSEITAMKESAARE